jgi:hypothetical protein
MRSDLRFKKGRHALASPRGRMTKRAFSSGELDLFSYCVTNRVQNENQIAWRPNVSEKCHLR